MRQRSLFKALVMGLMLVGLARPSESRADQTPVHAGYDLFHTLKEGTVFDFGDPFNSQNLMGVPIGSFDFGAPIGSHVTGNTDTIVQRLDDVLTDGGTTRLLMRALQLESVNAVDALGNHLFVTLNAQNPSDGSMQIFERKYLLVAYATPGCDADQWSQLPPRRFNDRSGFLAGSHSQRPASGRPGDPRAEHLDHGSDGDCHRPGLRPTPRPSGVISGPGPCRRARAAPRGGSRPLVRIERPDEIGGVGCRC